MKAGFLEPFQEHMPVLVGCLLKPPEDALNALVDCSLRPVAWNALYDIIDITMASISRLISHVDVVEIAAGKRCRSVDNKSAGPHRQWHTRTQRKQQHNNTTQA